MLLFPFPFVIMFKDIGKKEKYLIMFFLTCQVFTFLFNSRLFGLNENQDNCSYFLSGICQQC